MRSADGVGFDGTFGLSGAAEVRPADDTGLAGDSGLWTPTGAELPERPSIPVVLPVLAVVVALDWLALGGQWAWAALVACVSLGAAAYRGGRRTAFGVVAVLLAAGLSLACCALRGEALARELAGGVAGWEFAVLGDASATRYGWRCRARAYRPHEGLGGTRGDVWLSLNEPVEYGQVLTVVGEFAPNGGDEWGTSSRRQGVWGQVRVRSIRGWRWVAGPAGLAVGFRRRALDVLDAGSSDARALLAGCVCGRRVELVERGLDELFSTCGVAHLLAVSGGHIAVVSALVGAACLRLGLAPGARGMVSTLVSGLFVLCCGAPASAIRSWLMAVAALGSGVVGRREHALSSVCVAALAMALASPGVAGQLGYLLSVSSVVALCLFSPYAGYAARELVPLDVWRLPLPWGLRGFLAGRISSLRSSLAASLVCLLATVGLVSSTFGRVSLVGPLAGLLVGPLFTPLVALGSTAAALASLPGASLLCRLLLAGCDTLAWLMVACLRWLTRLPFAAVAVEGSAGLALGLGTLVAAAALYRWWPPVRPRRVWGCLGVAMALLAVLVLRWRWLSPARIVVLDVGQGDAILVQDGAAAVLVDAGPEGALAAALSREHVLHLDAVIVTHLHADHYGGLADLVATVGCDDVLVGQGVAAGISGELADAVGVLDADGVAELAYGDELVVGGWRLRMVWPREPRGGDENADSIELVATYERGGRTLTALLTGDAERDETAAVIAAGDVGDIDFLKVGHHGSSVSLTAEEAALLDAEVAVASAGEGNSYGHPTSECVDVLEAAGSFFLCTMDVGDVTIEPGRAGPVVRLQRGAGLGEVMFGAGMV